MKIIHLSDLHIGKRVNEFSMLDDQKYILEQILKICRDEEPEAVIIAGDVYDKSVPSAEAVALFDDFLCQLSASRYTVLVISGNHDSAERIAFGGRLMCRSGVYMSPSFNGTLKKVTLKDAFGNVNFYLFPFIKPVQARAAFPDAQINDYTDALRVVFENTKINAGERNVLIAHQLVTGASQCDSEDISVGGLDNVDAAVFESFDYVALGHIHSPQKISRETIRYCGTPLKYSFSEANHQKSVTVTELEGKGHINIRTVPLIPLRDMREIKGEYAELTDQAYYRRIPRTDYFHITLTDEEDIPDAMGKLRTIYPNIMKLDYDNRRTRANNIIRAASGADTKSPLELFSEFYKLQNNSEMSTEQTAFVNDLIKKIWEDVQ